MCFAAACRVTVVEAKELLGTFDGSLREYAARKLVAQGVKLRKVCWYCICGRTWCTPWVYELLRPGVVDV